MNTYQAKRIPLHDLLAALGHQPRREVRGELWYLSPLRREASASFKVNVAGNVWYDFGEGRGGNLLDFVMAYYRLEGDVKAALEKLDGLGVSAGEPAAPAPGRGKPPASSRNAPESSITLVKTQVLRNRALFDYLHARGIKPITARPFVQEAYYTLAGRDRTFFALAFPNEAGGYELRSKYFQGVVGSKDLSIVPGRPAGAVAVFEGFMDFLSWLTLEGRPAPDMPVIVLNSVALKDRAVEAIRRMDAAAVHLYLDHDTGGRETTAYLQAQLADREVRDHAPLYAGYKDVNEFLMGQRAEGRVAAR
ncbi:MAG: toprim domain-containing protein [Anaerolineae bacterium]|nr:toprim domain-containing protein [Anaerolineae bacterium]